MIGKYHPLSLLLLAVFCSSSMAADLETLTQSCDGCHGVNGVSEWNDMPTIAGIDAFVHSEALYIYQDGARPCQSSEYRQGDTSRPATNMCDIAAELGEEDVEALAEYYAELPFVPAAQEFDAGLASAGMAVHERDCAVCHSAGGSDPADESSILAGQWMGYLKTSFERIL